MVEEIKGLVSVPKRVRGDWPIGHMTIAEPGTYDAYCNKYGAVSVLASNGKLLGLKPNEFQWLTEKPEFTK